MEPQEPHKETPPTASEVLQAIIRTAHYIRQEFESDFSEREIPAFMTGPRLRVLIAISEAGSIRMNDLAVKMGIKAITVTQFVDALEKENLLIRVPDPTDRRATLLQLTETAPPLIQKARKASGETAEKMLESLPVEMRSQLLDILSQITNFRQACLLDSKEMK